MDDARPPPDLRSSSGSTRSAPATASRSERAVVREQRRSVEHAEHLGDLRRFRAGLMVSTPTWCVFGVLDWIAATWGADGAATLTWLWTIRWGLLPVALVVLWGAFKAAPASPRLLRTLDIGLYGLAAWGVALMAVGYGGITSSYLTGILMVIVGRGAFTAQPWRSALLPNAVIASSAPIVMGVASLLVPAIRGQLASPAALATAVHYLFFIYGTMVLMVAASHYAWTLRRQLFESRSIGRYRLKHRLATGGMGEVWAAYHPGLKRDIALKILRSDASGDPTAIARFEREVKATSELSHPNTIRVFDFGSTDDGIFYYAMELLEGMTLSELVRAEGRIAPARAVHFTVQTALSLAEAHDRGIVHRDVKPANLFVTTAGNQPDFVKVLDFGIAKRVADAPRAAGGAGDAGAAEDESEREAELTGTGLVAGTPRYMAPEVVLGAEATPRSDVYGIGAVLYCLLTGRAPFDGMTPTAIYAAHLTDAVTEPSVVLGGSLAPELERIVLRCLAKDPRERFADAGQLAHALQDLALAWNPRRIATTKPPPPQPGAVDPDEPTAVRGEI
ncbi:MAG: serine/threonine protein kinase [Labilithrix sp.]|nr:serine/threonine protein kinase [Labilithrix sp.]